MLPKGFSQRPFFKNMLKTQPKTSLVEKIIRNNNGEVFRAYFLVIFDEGRYVAKLVKVEKVIEIGNKGNQESGIKNQGYFLPIKINKVNLTAKSYKLKAILSPYFLNTFFTSQMTRAPSGSF